MPEDSASQRLLCDEMLRRLGSWLRAAGYDTEIAGNGMPDREVLRLCAEEARTLVTRDRSLAGRARWSGRVLLLTSDAIPEQAAVLRAAGIDWLHAPFTRCLIDNTPLAPASETDAERIPSSSRALPGPLRTCPACRRVYWPGSHLRRMERVLRGWTGRTVAPDPVQ
jgi:uncharacterized protein